MGDTMRNKVEITGVNTAELKVIDSDLALELIKEAQKIRKSVV